MAGNGIKPIQVAYTWGGWEDSFIQTFPEGVSQTFKGGMPLKFGSGTVIAFTSDTAPAIAGIAMADAHNTTAETASTATCKVILPLSQVIFAVSVDTDFTSGQPAPGTGKPSDFTIGALYTIAIDSTSGLACMITETDNPTFTLIGYDPSQASVIQGRVYARILASQTAWT